MKFSAIAAVNINFYQPSTDVTSNHFYLLQNVRGSLLAEVSHDEAKMRERPLLAGNVRGIPASLLVKHYPARWYITPT